MWQLCIKSCHIAVAFCSPGGGLRSISEAEAMKRYAQRVMHDSIPREAVVLEESSTSTRTNALNSLQLLAGHRCR